MEAEMVSSLSKWTINQSNFGMSLDQLAQTQMPDWSEFIASSGIPLPKPLAYFPRTVDDFCPRVSSEGYSILNIIPFSELAGVLRDGDIIVFMQRQTNLDVLSLLKQRGWHAEIAFRNTDGCFVQCAPWCGESEIIDHPCLQLQSHRHYDSPSWNLHIFRVVADRGTESQLVKLLSGVRNWRTIYHQYTFPSENWQFDPVDFVDINGLENIARELIRIGPVPAMYCMQWVHAVLSLALNVPLNRSTLTRLGVMEEFHRNWPQLQLEEDVQPLGRLPIQPYTPSDLISAFNHLYLGYSQSELDVLLPQALTMPAFQTVLSGAPPYSIPPITPFTEYRKPAHKGNFEWKYVATAFNETQCIVQR
jgi:hypothetical protein